MKTLHITNAWHATSGGIRSFYLELIRRANEWKRPIRLIVPGERDRTEEMGAFGRVYYIESKRAPFNADYRMISPRSYLGAGAPIVRILREENPDLVEICDKYTLPCLGGLIRIGKLPGYDSRPLVVALSCERMDENVGAYVREGFAGRLVSRFYMKSIYFPQADHHLAVSQHAAGELGVAAKGHKVKRGVWLTPMGVDAELFTPARRSRKEDGTVRLLYTGRLVPEKNIGLILDTMEELKGALPRFRLVVAGTGTLHESFEAEARKRAPGLVEMMGHVGEREQLADLYANCDIFLHPNPREPFGIAPLEAMASGMALVAPHCGGVTTYANNLNAWLTAPDGGSFAAAVQNVLADPAASARKREAARATASKYAWNSSCDRFFQLYEQLRGNSKDDGDIPAAFYSTPGNWLGQEIEPDRDGAFTTPD